MREVHPQNGFILFNTAQKCQYGAFKSMQEGQINLVGPCPFSSTPASSSHAATVVSVALKQPYRPNHNSTPDSSISIVSTLCLSPDDQVKELVADSLSIQWAGALLQDVYNFIVEYHQCHSVTCPVTIPQFRFVTFGLAMTNTPGTPPTQKEVFLVEELIRQDGPWRKYINNNSSKPSHFSDHENFRRSQFLAFCQHVQYWRTRCLAFTSDFQGECRSNFLIVHLTNKVA